MANRDPQTPHPEDLPWNDEPADSDVVIGSAEPDPAEVVGDAGEEVDISHRGVSDPEHRDTLEERLAEEEPDRPLHAQADEVGDLVAPEAGSDDLVAERAEPDQGELEAADIEPAEGAAMHISSEGRA
ncbi:MAG: hypothetical protein JF886_04570 [Candidatus Dormibacteraeota bacterium]|uniref:DUF5709 domain-containing protein n=1 Tax=Candidatus Aeolococcus gillhamiae TaxID=3127015 RepID=A0A934K1Y8_9BACT|nr:hypothetical protein [Candidatus Dormibacteraeota bacterium]